jgi:hypothetical protein
MSRTVENAIDNTRTGFQQKESIIAADAVCYLVHTISTLCI